MRVSAGIIAAVVLAAAAAEGQQQQRALLLYDAAHLADVRARIQRGDAALAPAFSALEADANKALAMKPVSVMDKAVTPPSGDKHDYMSQAPYWWPDPAKPDGRPYIRRDGDRNPEINRITDHDNLGRVVGAVSTLGLAFHLTGREAYAAHAVRLTRAWFLDPATRMSPHLRFGQGIPGINDGRGIGIIETRGLPELIDGVALLLVQGSSSWTQADERGLQAWMRAYLTWLLESAHGKDEAKNGNNHETWYDVQVAGLALDTGQRHLARRTIEGGARASPRRSSRTAASHASWSARARGITARSTSKRSSAWPRWANASASISGTIARPMAAASGRPSSSSPPLPPATGRGRIRRSEASTRARCVGCSDARLSRGTNRAIRRWRGGWAATAAASSSRCLKSMGLLESMKMKLYAYGGMACSALRTVRPAFTRPAPASSDERF